MIIKDPIVLLVDDSETDVLLMQTVFERAGFVLPLQFAHDGVEAIAYLNGDGRYQDRALFPLPSVMLLDLNMPRKDGFEVLAWVRQQPTLKRLRIYVLSASNRAEDIRRAYDLGANSYLVKPGNLDGLMQMAKTLVAWLRGSHFAPLVEIPKDHQSPAAPAFLPRPDSHPSLPLTAFANPPAKEPHSARDMAWNEVCLLNEELGQRLKKQTAQLMTLKTEKASEARALTHDLRTPLMTIGGYADLLAQRWGTKLDGEGRQYLQKIAEATEQLTQLVAAISAASKAAQPVPAALTNRPRTNSAA